MAVCGGGGPAKRHELLGEGSGSGRVIKSWEALQGGMKGSRILLGNTTVGFGHATGGTTEYTVHSMASRGWAHKALAGPKVLSPPPSRTTQPISASAVILALPPSSPGARQTQPGRCRRGLHTLSSAAMSESVVIDPAGGRLSYTVRPLVISTKYSVQAGASLGRPSPAGHAATRLPNARCGAIRSNCAKVPYLGGFKVLLWTLGRRDR